MRIPGWRPLWVLALALGTVACSESSPRALDGVDPLDGGSRGEEAGVDAGGGDADEADASLPDATVPDPLRILTETLPVGREGEPYEAEVTARGGSGQGYRWSLAEGGLPGGIFLRSEGTPSTVVAGRPRATGASLFTLRVRDSAGEEARRRLAFEVGPASGTVRIVTTELPPAEPFRDYEAFIEAIDGTDLTWRVVSGALPSGLGLEGWGPSSARIFGAPTVDGRFVFALQVEDERGNRDQASFVLEVLQVDPALRIVSGLLPPARVAQPYQATIVSSGGSGTDRTWEVVLGQLPPGLSLARVGSPGVLSGTPTQAGSFTFRIQVTDERSDVARRTFLLDVAP